MHFTRLRRRTAVGLIITAVAVGGTASVASAKTTKFKINCTSTIVGATTTTDKCTSSALGNGTGKSNFVPPDFKSTEKFAKVGKCSFKGTSKVNPDGKTHVNGTVTCKGGKGAFKKGAKGKYESIASLKNGVVSGAYSGSLKTK